MYTAHEIADGVRSGTLTPSDVLSEYLFRIDEAEDHVDAWVEINDISARRRTRELEALRSNGDALGLLAGVPVGVKDIVDVYQFSTQAGAPEFAHRRPREDSHVAKRLREAGAVLLGKTHTTEFAYLDPAPTRNPWNRDHTPGGSSSGSAAVVASGMAPLALGTQTVGSVLRPAGYCGIVGFKPSFGRIGYSGVYALASSYDHLGLLVTCVHDAALGLSALAGHDPADPNSLDLPVEDYVAAIAQPRAPRLGIPRNYFEGLTEPENAAQLAAVAEKLRSAGAEVFDVTFMDTAPTIAEASSAQLRYEAAHAHAEMYAANRDEYRPNIKALIEAGIATSDADYERAREYVGALRDSMGALLEDVDALLLPTAPGTAPADLTTTGPGIFCGPASFTGLPAISLPSGLSDAGMPFAIQLIGPALGESKLLNVAAWIEGVLGFDAKPSVGRRS